MIPPARAPVPEPVAALWRRIAQPVGRLWRRLGPWVAGGVVLALAQSLAIGWMVLDRVQILRSEQEITLTPEPVDPRDLFRGDYVILSYPIEAPPRAAADEENDFRQPRRPFAEGRALWARIAPDAGGVWRTVELTARRPAATGDAVWLRATADGFRDGAHLVVRRLRFGLERYYVPEGEGRPLERLIGEKRLQVRVAISEDGRAAIKGLSVDGEAVFEEPWF